MNFSFTIIKIYSKFNQEKFYKELCDFIKEITLSTNTDAVIIPEIVVRQAKLAGDRTYWDGVSRKIEMGNEFVSPDAYNFTGTTYALSFKIAIFSFTPDINHQLFSTPADYIGNEFLE